MYQAHLGLLDEKEERCVCVIKHYQLPIALLSLMCLVTEMDCLCRVKLVFLVNKDYQANQD